MYFRCNIFEMEIFCFIGKNFGLCWFLRTSFPSILLFRVPFFLSVYEVQFFVFLFLLFSHRLFPIYTDSTKINRLGHNIRMYWTNFRQPTAHVQQNIFEKTLIEVCSPHLYASFRTFCVQIGQLQYYYLV